MHAIIFDYADFGKSMKSFRKAKGYSMEELARLADITKGTISLMESNQNMPRPETMLKICEILGIKMNFCITTSKTDLARMLDFESRQERKNNT
jgi:transcriptional regulator with XRE-family HTH domain